MTRDKYQFISLNAINEGLVTYGDNCKDKIIGHDDIKITPTTSIKNILPVDRLLHNLSSIS